MRLFLFLLQKLISRNSYLVRKYNKQGGGKKKELINYLKAYYNGAVKFYQTLEFKYYEESYDESSLNPDELKLIENNVFNAFKAKHELAQESGKKKKEIEIFTTKLQIVIIPVAICVLLTLVSPYILREVEKNFPQKPSQFVEKPIS